MFLFVFNFPAGSGLMMTAVCRFAIDFTGGTLKPNLARIKRRWGEATNPAIIWL